MGAAERSKGVAELRLGLCWADLVKKKMRGERSTREASWGLCR